MKVREKLIQKGILEQPKSFSDIWAVFDEDEPFDNVKADVSDSLTMLLAFSGVSRKSLGESTGWTKSRISKILSGFENLTLKTVFEIAKVAGYEFDITFRKKSQRKPIQPWQNLTSVFESGKRAGTLYIVPSTPSVPMINTPLLLSELSNNSWVGEQQQRAAN